MLKRIKPKAKSSKWYRNKCDELAGLLCRSKGRCEAEGYGGIRCSDRLEWAHCKSRRFIAIRHDKLNSLCLCNAHHRHFTEHPDHWTSFVEQTFPGRWDYLNERLRDNSRVDWHLRYVALTEAVAIMREEQS